MKRYNNLLPKILDMDNLYLAYWKAKKGKEAKAEVMAYSKNLNENILRLQRQVQQGLVEVGNYRYFKIYDPKERLICAAPFPQRVLHHAIMNVCGPLFDKRQIEISYACRYGKGTYGALYKAIRLHRRYKWCVKMDFRKYFDSIDHDVLKIKLSRLFKEKDLLQILYSIIDSYDCEKEGKGLPIGNLTSQYFANHYLSDLDHYALETLKVDGYVRYMDDVLAFGDDRKLLIEKLRQYRSVAENKLLIDFKVFDVRSRCQSVQFLGYRLVKGTVLLSQRSKKRFCTKMTLYKKLYEKGVWTDDEYQRHLMPLMAFVLKAQSKAVRKKVLQRDVS